MAINFVDKIKALSSIYSDDRKDRELEVHYSLPEGGINEETGILMCIAGFRGFCNANVFKKFRRTFADKYNLITIQCDYFGYQYMRKPMNLNLTKKQLKSLKKVEIVKLYKEGNGKVSCDDYFKLCEEYGFKEKVKEKIEENIDDFNEMGLMQALDNMNALQHVVRKLKKGEMTFNSNKIIFFGNSQGAYLSYLCNILVPGMISLIVDNSGWVFPEFIKKNERQVNIKNEKAHIRVLFDYMARDVIDDYEILNLNNLYKDFDNKCKIIAFHGVDDKVISLDEKESFLSNVNNSELNKITPDNVDGKKFSNYKHGLGANFIHLFDSIMEREDIVFSSGGEFKMPMGRYLESSSYHYVIDFSGQYPVLARAKK